MKRNIKEAKAHLKKARELMAKTNSGFEGMTLEEAIQKIRRVREKLWEEKLAFRS